MTDLFAFMLTFPAVILLAAGLLPNPWLNARAAAWRRVVTLVAGLQFVVAASFAIAHAVGWVPTIHWVPAIVSNQSPMAAALYYDGVASLMFTLVSFVGWVICRYSIRYLDGEATQGRFFRWTAFTVGAVSLMVLSGNLLMFVAAWVMTSMGLHQLLLHYGHRPAARRAAWTKFTISRIGDVALVAALIIIFREFRTLDFAELSTAVGSLPAVTTMMQVAGFLLVAGAVTKSAQFPFHTWLPQTMETPTPVSALMHAGIVNAGGYLIIRTSPLVSLTPSALTTLAIVGGVTACFAAVVMLTQTSVKRSLAYSTIAQMGFMMLQCGLGAFSAAMLHIVAHSLYKAHAFLSSGSLITSAGDEAPTAPTVERTNWSLVRPAVAGATSVTFLAVSFAVFGIDPMTKPGGLLLGGVFCLALTYWVGQVTRSGSRAILVRGLAVAGGLCFVYSASFVTVDKIVAPSLHVSGLSLSTPPEQTWLVAVALLVGFGGMFLLHAGLATGRGLKTLNKWHVHASNGFYLENSLRRVFEPLVNN